MDTRKPFAVIYSELTPRERAVLTLRLWKEDRPVEPHLRHGLSVEGAREYNRYIDLLSGAHESFGTFAIAIGAGAEQLNLRAGWLQTFSLWEIAIAQLQGRVTGALEREGMTQEQRQAVLAEFARELEVKGKTKALSARTRTQETVLSALLCAYRARCAELAAAEVVLEEVAKEFGGDDPLHPRIRDALTAAKAGLWEIGELLSCYGEQPAQPEPNTELAGALRERLWAGSGSGHR